MFCHQSDGRKDISGTSVSGAGQRTSFKCDRDFVTRSFIYDKEKQSLSVQMEGCMYDYAIFFCFVMHVCLGFVVSL